MKLNTYCCLLVCILGWNVTAGESHRVVNESRAVTLPCHRSMDGSVTWSRDTNGSKVNLIIAHGAGDDRLNDPERRFSSLGDKSLFFLRASVSDSGRYFCNDEPAADLTVIPSGTRTENVTEGTRVSLNCPHPVGGSDDHRWRKEIAGKPQRIRLQVSTEEKTLVLPDAKPADSGLYFCGGKAAVYLAVNEATTTPPSSATTTTTTTTTPLESTGMTRSTTTMKTLTSTAALIQTDVTASPPPLYLLIGVGVFILLIIIIIIVVFTRRFKREKRDLHRSTGVDESVYYTIDFPGGSLSKQRCDKDSLRPSDHRTVEMSTTMNKTNGCNQSDDTYASIPHLPQTGNSPESPYSLLGHSFSGGSKVLYS